MILIVVAAVGTALCNGSAFFKLGVGSLSLMSLYFVATFLYYCDVLIFMARHDVRIERKDRKLAYFMLWGGLCVALSYLGFFDFVVEGRLLVDHSFVARQAYFLFFLPLAIVVPLRWKSSRISEFIRDYASSVGILVYGSYALLNGTLALKVQITFLLAGLVLLSRKKGIVSYLLAAVVVLSPIGVGGELTQVLVRVIFLLYLLFEREQVVVSRIMVLSIGASIASSLLAGFIYNLFSLSVDSNSLWRLAYWADEMATLSASYGGGVGFGTSYASLDFLGPAVYGGVGGPFGGEEGFTFLEKIFITGSHSSFVSISFRMGVVGIILFLSYLMDSYTSSLSRRIVVPAIPFVFFSSMVIVAFNVGVESPSYLFIFIAGIAAPSMGVVRDDREKRNLDNQKGLSGRLPRTSRDCGYGPSKARSAKIAHPENCFDANMGRLGDVPGRNKSKDSSSP